MAEDHRLCNGERPIQITQGCELVLLVLADDVELLDGVERLLLTPQPDDVWIRNDRLGEPPHGLLEGCGEEEHLTLLGEPTARGSGTDSKSERIAATVCLRCSYRWMRMLWSRCPCVAIITSASSKMNMVIFLGSMRWYLVHQSRIVPGVPMTICSCSGTPLSTAEEVHAHRYYNRQFVVVVVAAAAEFYSLASNPIQRER